MKTVEKIETLLNQYRERVSLALILLTISLYLLACEKRFEEAEVAEVPAKYVTTTSAAAQSIPEWAPEDANPQVRYYYLPTAEVYYDTYIGQYVYNNGTEWVYTVSLPRVYASIDLYTAPLVFLNIGVFQPWRFHTHYVGKYHYYKQPGWHSHFHHARLCYDKGWPPAYGARSKFAGGPKHGAPMVHKPGPNHNGMWKGNGKYSPSGNKIGDKAGGGARKPITNHPSNVGNRQKLPSAHGKPSGGHGGARGSKH